MKVYLLGNVDVPYWKIGVAKNPWKRLRQLDQTKLPFRVLVLLEFEVGAAAYFIEKLLKRDFAADHARGEWYSGQPHVTAFQANTKKYYAAWNALYGEGQ